METNLLLVFALVLIIEGFLPALFPNRWRAYLLKITQMPVTSIRLMGGLSLVCGLTILLLNDFA